MYNKKIHEEWDVIVFALKSLVQGSGGSFVIQSLQGWWPIPVPLQPLLMETLTARANWVLRNHPIIWFRETVTELIDRGQLKLNFNMVLKKGASFDATGDPNSGGTAQLSLNAGGLLFAKTDEDFLGIMLTVRHEYVHYWRWKHFTAQDEIIMTDPKSHLLEYCQFRWDDERDAEFQTCPANIAWDMVEGMRAVCLYSDNAADFDHAYFMLILMQRERIGIDAIPGARHCLQCWAVIASHPNPNEFKNYSSTQ